MIHLRCYVLLGGLGAPGGIDSYLDSPGLFEYSREIAAIPGVDCVTRPWPQYQSLTDDLRKLPSSMKACIVGYSGGGTRGIYLANSVARKVELLVLIDPSPKWQMEQPKANVEHVLLFHNTMPLMWPLGGGDLAPAKPPQVLTRVEIHEQHALVQADANVRNMTLTAVRNLITPVLVTKG